MDLIINEVIIGKSPSNNKITGTFKCECGFVYRRYDWDEEGQRKYEYDCVLSYGETFHKRLIELRKQGVIAKEMARLLDVSCGMIRSQLRSLLANNLVPINKPDSSSISGAEISKIRKNYRAIWLKSRKENPGLKRSKLARLNSINSKIYVWMLSNDRKWFEENSPIKVITERQPTRVNWEERDKILCAKVKELTKQILNSSGKPVRITVYGISTTLKFAYIIRRKPELLPKTNQVLRKNAESIEEFIVRRIRFVEESFKQERNEASYWKLLSRANVMSPRLIKLPKVQMALGESLKRLEQAKISGWVI